MFSSLHLSDSLNYFINDYWVLLLWILYLLIRKSVGFGPSQALVVTGNTHQRGNRFQHNTRSPIRLLWFYLDFYRSPIFVWSTKIIYNISPSFSLTVGGGDHHQRQQSGGHRPISHRAAADQRYGGGGESGPEPPENPRRRKRRRGRKSSS